MQEEEQQPNLFDVAPLAYNTSWLPEQEQVEIKRAAKGQESRIMKFFNENPDSSFTPFEVHAATSHGELLTSTRRAIRNLEKNNLLIKTDEMRDGGYGVKNHCWRIK